MKNNNEVKNTPRPSGAGQGSQQARPRRPVRPKNPDLTKQQASPEKAPPPEKTQQPEKTHRQPFKLSAELLKIYQERPRPSDNQPPRVKINFSDMSGESGKLLGDIIKKAITAK